MSYARVDFVAKELGRARSVITQALEEKQRRIVAAPFEVIADWAHLLQVAGRRELFHLAGFQI